jgi:ABC-type nitrate/sulfonate/bicarbonate transport system substrate-binding protein
MTMLRSRFLAGAAAGSATAAWPHQARAQSNAMLRIGTVLVQLYGAPYFGTDAGAFTKAGFDTTVTARRSRPPSPAARWTSA